MRTIASGSFVTGLALFGAGAAAMILPGCYVEAEPVPVPVTSAEVLAGDGYEPSYYDGYVVYYDSLGRPFYYNGTAQIYVAPTSPYYPGLVDHWHVYGPAYGRWYNHYGYRYRSYRAAPGHTYYHGYPHR
jgi:hypothetical protein